MKLKNNKGITLIALVITIIVLLILAGVSIAMLTGENGLLTKASDAKQATERAGAKEAVQMEVAGSFTNDGTYDMDQVKENLKKNLGIAAGDIKDNLDGSFDVTYKGVELTVKPNGEVVYKGEGGTPTPPSASVTPGEIVTGENKQYTNNGTAVIPKGFAIVPGLDDVLQGLVISDVANDTNNQGNQFVWIPVTDMNEFKRREGCSNGSLQTLLSNCGEADANGINEYLQKNGLSESDVTKQEAIDMYKSIETNKGFYIGRYETSKGASGNAEVKKNKQVWNNISWSNSNTMNIDVGGAVEKARKMYTDKNTYGVTSTLCYGVQWDATLRFIDPNYTGYAKDSTGKGNYSRKNLINTGSNDTYAVKNIYDMAGNVEEWTMESFSTNNRVVRGANFTGIGFITPSSVRLSVSPTGSRNIGFRVTLYV